MNILKILVIITGIIAFIILLQYAGNPLLFSLKPENERTLSHTNFQILPPVSTSQKQSVEPLMNEFFGSSATVVVSIKAKDFNKAQKSLSDLDTASRSFENIVVNLDLNGTDIETFRNENKKSIEDLKLLYKDSSDFENLKKLSLNIENTSDPQSVYSVSYEGKAIRDRVKNSYERFKEGYQELTEAGTNLNLSNSEFNQTNNDFLDIVNEIDTTYQENEKRANDLIRSSKEKLSLDALTLSISPNKGNYGDKFVFEGSLQGKGELQNRTIAIILDSRFFQNVTTDDHGNFYLDYIIGQRNEGPHMAFSEFQSLASNISYFSIGKAKSELTLTAEPRENGTTHIYGTLFTGKIPVSKAPVKLLVNRKSFSTLLTDDIGLFNTTETFKPGRVIISAEFSNTSFPLSPSVSREITLTIGKSGKNLIDQIIDFFYKINLQIILIICICLLFVLIFLFNKKIKRILPGKRKHVHLRPVMESKSVTEEEIPIKTPAPDDIEDKIVKEKIKEEVPPDIKPEIKETDVAEIKPSIEFDTILAHQQLFESMKESNPRDAVRHLLFALLLNITEPQIVEAFLNKTPHELIPVFFRQFKYETVILFVYTYEVIRYGEGWNSEEVDLLDSLYYLLISFEWRE